MDKHIGFPHFEEVLTIPQYRKKNWQIQYRKTVSKTDEKPIPHL